jgi:hypothetical protein
MVIIIILAILLTFSPIVFIFINKKTFSGKEK